MKKLEQFPFCDYNLSETYGVYARCHEGELFYSCIDRVKAEAKKMFPEIVQLDEDGDVLEMDELISFLPIDQVEDLAVAVFHDQLPKSWFKDVK